MPRIVHRRTKETNRVIDCYECVVLVIVQCMLQLHVSVHAHDKIVTDARGVPQVSVVDDI